MLAHTHTHTLGLMHAHYGKDQCAIRFTKHIAKEEHCTHLLRLCRAKNLQEYVTYATGKEQNRIRVYQ